MIIGMGFQDFADVPLHCGGEFPPGGGGDDHVAVGTPGQQGWCGCQQETGGGEEAEKQGRSWHAKKMPRWAGFWKREKYLSLLVISVCGSSPAPARYYRWAVVGWLSSIGCFNHLVANRRVGVEGEAWTNP